MSHRLELQEGAIVISDAHYSHLRPELLLLIEDIASKKIQTSQLILMGDIFDTLFGQVSFTQEVNKAILSLLHQISQDIELIYLEGNHDFNLQKIFPFAKVFSLSSQPVLCSYGTKKVALAHGDFDGKSGYKLYTKLIRNPILLSFLSLLDHFGNHFILKKLDNYLAQKDDCKEFIGFKKFIQNRALEEYACDYFIEGHYHQNRVYSFEKFTYINLAAFACNQRYFIVKSNKDNELLKEIRLS